MSRGERSFSDLPYRLIVQILRDHYIFVIDSNNVGDLRITDFFGIFRYDITGKVFLLFKNVSVESIPDNWNDIPVKTMSTIELTFGVDPPPSLLTHCEELKMLESFYPIAEESTLPSTMEKLSYQCRELNKEVVEKVNQLKHLKSLEISGKSFEASQTALQLNNLQEMTITSGFRFNNTNSFFEFGNSYLPSSNESHLSQLKKLKILAEWDLRGEVVEKISKYEQLEDITFSRCRVNDLKKILTKRNLNTLTVRYGSISFHDLFLDSDTLDGIRAKKLSFTNIQNHEYNNNIEFGVDEFLDLSQKIVNHKHIREFIFTGVIGNEVVNYSVRKVKGTDSSKVYLLYGSYRHEKEYSFEKTETENLKELDIVLTN